MSYISVFSQISSIFKVQSSNCKRTLQKSECKTTPWATKENYSIANKDVNSFLKLRGGQLPTPTLLFPLAKTKD